MVKSHSLKKILAWAGSPYVLALPVAALIILLIPDVFQKYRSDLVRSGMIDKPNGFEYYADLDGDGFSERVILFDNTEGKASVKILDHNGFITGHHYFRGEILPSAASLTISPFDTSGMKGVFLFTLSNDSLLLHGVCPAGEKQTLFSHQGIAVIPEENGHHDFSVTSFRLFDLDGDGTREIVASVMVGFKVQPRFIFSYDLRTQTVCRTPSMATYQFINDTADINGDGWPELLAGSYAIDNNEGKLALPCDDRSAWLLAYDRTLEPVFPPVAFPGKYIHLFPYALGSKGRQHLIALLTTRVPGTGPPRLLMFDEHGKKQKERLLTDRQSYTNYSFVKTPQFPDRLVLLSDGGQAEVIDHELSAVKRFAIPGVKSPVCRPFDLDNDGMQEFLFPGNPGDPLVITRGDFSEPLSVIHPFDHGNLHLQAICESGSKGRLFIQSGNRYAIHTYERNPWFWLRYPLYLAIYCLVTGFIWMIRFLQRSTLQSRFDNERKLAEMQLLLLGNQLDPHFTFNAINSISASLLLQDSVTANRNLQSLSRLMRANVMQSDQIDRSLAEELEFIENYIGLIHSRMDGCFRYRIELEEGTDLTIRVPKMMTQIFVENAIKHGLKPILTHGFLQVRVRKAGDGIQIEVEDNGVGRKNSLHADEPGAGKGMRIVEQTLAILNRFNTKKILLEVTDGSDEQGRPQGTRVRLSVPAGVRYRFNKE